MAEDSRGADLVSVVVSGRVGANDLINGTYAPVKGETFGDLPVYKQKGGELYLYYHDNNGAWLIGTSLGEPAAPAYLPCEPDLPHLAKGVWNVAGGGVFKLDPNIKVAEKKAPPTTPRSKRAPPPIKKKSKAWPPAARKASSPPVGPPPTGPPIAPPPAEGSEEKMVAALAAFRDSEADFNSQLETVATEFAHAQGLHGVWTDEEHAYVFSNIDALKTASDALLAALGGSNCGPGVLAFTKGARAALGEFVGHRALAEPVLASNSDEKLAECEARNGGRSLAERLEALAAHAVEYESLVQALATATPASDSNKADLKQAAGLVDKLSRHLGDQQAAFKDTLDVLGKLQTTEGADAKLVCYGRGVFIKEPALRSTGPLNRQGSNKRGFSFKRKSAAPDMVDVYVCSDVLIFARDSTLLEAPIPLVDVTHSECKNETQFSITAGKQAHYFQMESQQQVLKIRQALSEQKAAGRSAAPARRTSPPTPPPVASPASVGSEGEAAASSSSSSPRIPTLGAIRTPPMNSPSNAKPENLITDVRSVNELVDRLVTLVGRSPSSKVGGVGEKELSDLKYYLHDRDAISERCDEINRTVVSLVQVQEKAVSKGDVAKHTAKAKERQAALTVELKRIEEELQVLELQAAAQDPTLIQGAKAEWEQFYGAMLAARKKAEEERKAAEAAARRKAAEEKLAAERAAREKAEAEARAAREKAEAEAAAAREAKEKARREAAALAEAEAAAAAAEKARAAAEDKLRAEAEAAEAAAKALKAAEDARAAAERAREIAEAEAKALREKAVAAASSGALETATPPVVAKKKKKVPPPPSPKPGRRASATVSTGSSSLKPREDAAPVATSTPTSTPGAGGAANLNLSALPPPPPPAAGDEEEEEGLDATLPPPPQSNEASPSRSTRSSAHLGSQEFQEKLEKAKHEAEKKHREQTITKKLQKVQEEAERAALEVVVEAGHEQARELALAKAREEKEESERQAAERKAQKEELARKLAEQHGQAVKLAEKQSRKESLKRLASKVDAEVDGVLEASSMGALHRRASRMAEEHSRQQLAASDPPPAAAKSAPPSVAAKKPQAQQAPDISSAKPGHELKALYKYKGKKISLAVGDVVVLQDKSDANWWKVKTADGVVGLVPVNYMAVNVSAPEEGEEQEEAAAASAATAAKTSPPASAPPSAAAAGASSRLRYKAKFKYKGKTLSFKVGDILELVSAVDANWLKVEKVGGGSMSSGLAPANYLEKMEESAAPPAQDNSAAGAPAADPASASKPEQKVKAEEEQKVKAEVPARLPSDSSPKKSVGRQVRALFAYDSKQGFSFAAGDMMTVEAEVDGNWWRVAHIDNAASSGLAPINYVEEVKQLSVQPGKMATAQFSYDSKQPNGLAFKAGDVLEVIQEVDANWWKVKKVGGGPRAQGLAPVNYLQVTSATDA